MKTAKRLAIILFGILLSMAGAAMFVSNSFNLDAFYDVGFVCDYLDTSYSSQVQEGGESDKDGRISIKSDVYHICLNSVRKVKKGKFLYLDIAGSNKKTISAFVQLFKGDDTTVPAVFEREYELAEGENCLVIDKRKFKSIVVWINNQPGTEFTLEKVQVREKKRVFSAERFLMGSAVIFILYLTFCMIVSKYVRRKKHFPDFYFLIDALQDAYISIGNALHSMLPQRMIQHRSLISTLLFSVMFIYMTVIDNANIYKIYFKYHMIVYIFILLGIGILNCGEHLRKVSWKTVPAVSCLLFWAFVCLSDFKVTKRYQFVGYIGIFVICFLIFVINNDKNQVIINAFKNAIHLCFLAGLAFVVLFRPIREGIRYLGFSRNPSVFAICLTTVLAVVLSEFDNYILGYIGRRRFAFHVLECGSIIMLILMSQSMGPFLTVGLIGVIWLARCRVYMYRKTQSHRAYLKLFCTAGVGIVVGGVVTYLAIRIVPSVVGHNIVMTNDMFQSKTDWGMSLYAYAAGIGDMLLQSRFYQKIAGGSLTQLLSNRNYYYMGYLRQMNLWGHKLNASVFAASKLPHNALLGIAYRYGVFALVPYITMILYVIRDTFRNILRNGYNSFLAFGVCFTGILMSMADNVEHPFIWVTWAATYLLMGIVFPDRELGCKV